MNAATFDTHAAVTALRDAGLDEAHATAIVNTVRDAVGEQVATKADLAALETRMVKFAIGLMGANVLLIVGLLKLL